MVQFIVAGKSWHQDGEAAGYTESADKNQRLVCWCSALIVSVVSPLSSPLEQGFSTTFIGVT